MEFNVIAKLFVVFWSIQDISGQLVKSGQCPKVKVKQDVDLKQFLGTWYQYATFGTRLFQGEGRCVTARYTYNSTTGKVDVLNTQIPKRGTFPSMSSIKGTLEFADSKSNEAKFVVTFPAPVIQSIKAPYWVLDTDYESFAVVYSCVDAVLAHAHIAAEQRPGSANAPDPAPAQAPGENQRVSGWILTRMQDLGHSPQDEARIEAAVAGALAEAGLHRSLFQTTNQTQCSNFETGHVQ